MKICGKCGKEFKEEIYVGKTRVYRQRKNAACFECVPYKSFEAKRDNKICQRCNKEFYPVLYVDGKRKWVRSRKYCFECIPYTPHSRCDSNDSKNQDWWKTKNTFDDKRQCRICKEYKDFNEFSPTNKYGNLSSYCKSCSAKKCRTTRQRFKEQCVEYKGGKCEKCGYDKCVAALEFHHRDPREKEFQVSYCKVNRLFDESIRLELDKCDCLCSNCHKETHYLLERSNV